MDRRTFLTFASIGGLFVKDIFASQNIYQPKDTLYSDNHSISMIKDIYIPQHQWNIFLSARDRLHRVKRHIGYGNFNIISFDTTLFYARNYSSIGAFTKEELNLLDNLFYEDPTKYQFYGKRTCHNITKKISKKDVVKIPHTGHYLYKGKPLADYTRVKKDIGDELILTSGVRGVVKQMSLYLDKIYRTKGNITKASHSIAPPGYSYHAISDFDVGKKGLGYDNFTSKFAKTDEFKKLKKLKYIAMRYKKNNKEGVRYEPWHVQVI